MTTRQDVKRSSGISSPAVVVGFTSPSMRLRPQNRWCEMTETSSNESKPVAPAATTKQAPLWKRLLGKG
jgi:hypothetical protein